MSALSNDLNAFSVSKIIEYSPIKAGRFTLLFDEGESAKGLLLESDDYLHRLTSIERALRMQAYGRSNNNEWVLREGIAEDEFEKYVVKQIRPWKAGERNRICEIFEKIDALAKGIFLKLPDAIHLVKTNGLEDIREADAYCRGHTMVLKQATVNKAPINLFIHELFHIQSQVDPARKKELYALVGFTECNEIELPLELAAKRLTNPDAPKLNVRIHITVGEEAFDVVPVLLYDADRGYGFFECLYIQLLAIENTGSQEKEDWRYRERNGKAMIFDPSESKDFHVQTGNNTKYNFHPEEILADNFVYMLLDRKDVPNEKLLNDIRDIFQRPLVS